MNTIAKSVIAMSIGLAAGTALADTSTFPASPNEAQAFSVPGSTRADRYSREAASAQAPGHAVAPANAHHSRFAPAWWRRGSPPNIPAGAPQEADG
jgi:hypothetical protein